MLSLLFTTLTLIQLYSRKIEESRNEIIASDFYKRSASLILKNSPTPPTHIVCFGIGHFGDCQISRYQLAFILAVKQSLGILTPIIFHEPILSASEVNILKTLHAEVYKTNLEGKCILSDFTTLAYLPHCPKQLTNNLIWRNWSANLSKLILICNSFTQLLDATPQRFLDIDANYITQILPYTKEYHLRNTFKFSDIFNDTSLHCFETDKIPIGFWNLSKEPVYPAENTELISSQLISELKF